MTEEASTYKGPQILFQTGALGPGSQLWALPSEEKTEWKRKIDWYLNFQISKLKNYKSLSFTEEFHNFLKTYDMELKPKNQNLELQMISCDNFLPCKMLLLVPLSNLNYEDWLQKLSGAWIKLLKPTMRIFLPQNFPLTDFPQLWPYKESQSDLTLVPNQRSGTGKI